MDRWLAMILTVSVVAGGMPLQAATLEEIGAAASAVMQGSRRIGQNSDLVTVGQALLDETKAIQSNPLIKVQAGEDHLSPKEKELFKAVQASVQKIADENDLYGAIRRTTANGHEALGEKTVSFVQDFLKLDTDDTGVVLGNFVAMQKVLIGAMISGELKGEWRPNVKNFENAAKPFLDELSKRRGMQPQGPGQPKRIPI